jgi:membrane-associated phospholipid phosphatase
LQRQIVVALLSLAAMLAPALAGAQEEQRMTWRSDWRRVGPLEYSTTAGFTLGYFGVRYVIPPADTALWTRPIWFDAATRDAIVIRSRRGRHTAGRISDAVLYLSILQPLFIDSFLIAAIQDQNTDVAIQMGVISTQSLSMTLFLNGVTKRLVARERPFGSACARDPEYTEGCEELERFRSYYSGHAAITATGAGLVCAHHTHLPLYGGGIADAGACLGALTGTLATGVLRIASDRHWATDVISGYLLGFSVGYLLPTLLYYRSFQSHPESTNGSSSSALMAPQLGYSGTF